MVVSFARKKNEKATNLSHQRRFFYKLPKEQTEKLVRYNNLLYDLVLTVIGCVRKTFSFLARSRTNCFALLFEYTIKEKISRSIDGDSIHSIKNNISHSAHATVSCLCHTYLSLYYCSL